MGSYATLLTAESCCETTVCSPVVRSSLGENVSVGENISVGVGLEA